MMRVLVFGKNGQLARALARNANIDKNVSLRFVSSSTLDLSTQLSDISTVISNKKNIDAVINAAAYTNLDNAETRDCQKAYALNALAPEQMAKACKTKNIPFVHLSTDCVFGGNKRVPYKPNDKPGPINFYGYSKYEGEKFVRAVGGRSIVFRTSWVFSPEGQNFFGTMLKLAQKNSTINVVDDQIGSPTYADHLARALLHACTTITRNKNRTFAPLYHIAGTGAPVSRYHLAKQIFKMAGLKTDVRPISSTQFAAAAQRPAYCALDSASFERDFGYNLPNWQDGLKLAVSNYKASNEH